MHVKLIEVCFQKGHAVVQCLRVGGSRKSWLPITYKCKRDEGERILAAMVNGNNYANLIA